MTEDVTEVEYKDVIVIFKGVLKDDWPSTLTVLIYFGSNPNKIDNFKNIIHAMGILDEFPEELKVNDLYWMKGEELEVIENLLKAMGEEIEVFSLDSLESMPDWVFEMYELIRQDKEDDITATVRSHYVRQL